MVSKHVHSHLLTAACLPVCLSVCLSQSQDEHIGTVCYCPSMDSTDPASHDLTDQRGEAHETIPHNHKHFVVLVHSYTSHKPTRTSITAFHRSYNDWFTCNNMSSKLTHIYNTCTTHVQHMYNTCTIHVLYVYACTCIIMPFLSYGGLFFYVYCATALQVVNALFIVCVCACSK